MRKPKCPEIKKYSLFDTTVVIDPNTTLVFTIFHTAYTAAITFDGNRTGNLK